MACTVSDAPAKGLEHAGRILVGEQAEDQVERPAGHAAEMIGDGARGGADCGRRRATAPAPAGAGRAAARAPSSCSRAGHSAQPIAARSADSGIVERLLVAQHRHRERGVHRLMGAGEARQRQARAAPLVAIVERAVAGPRRPRRSPRGSQSAPAAAAASPIGAASLAGIVLRDQRHAALGDAGFLGGDLLDRVAEEGLMVDAELGDAADDRRGDDVGRVEPAAEPDLDDAGVGGRAGEGEEGGGGGRLEEAELHPVGGVEHLGEQRGEQSSSISRPARRMRSLKRTRCGLGIDMGLEPRRLDRGAQEGAGRALAVGAGDMEDRRQRGSGLPSRSSRAEIRSRPEMSRAGRKQGQPVELGLDAGIVGTARSIGHLPPAAC